jgi:hypothetical protein
MRQVVLLLILVSAQLVAAAVTGTASFDRADLFISRQGSYDNVELRGGVALVQSGAPRVPRVVERVLVPAGAEPTGVELLDVDWATVPGRCNLAPAQPDVPLPMPGEAFNITTYGPDPVVYSVNAYYPTNCIRLLGSGTLAGYRMALVELLPVRVNPVSGELQLARRIQYRVSYDAGNRDAFVPSSEQREYYAGMVRAVVANPTDASRFQPSVRRSAALTLPDGYYEYVVISAPPLDTCFGRLTDWKTLKGVPATTVSLTYITASYSGHDTQDKIRNFIRDAYENWGTRYVLLGGSADHRTAEQNIIPARDCWYATIGGDWRDTIPCDLYYGGLDGTWNANNNHLYGQTMDSADMYSEVFVGRASVYTVAQAQNFVDKTLAYEQDPPSGYLTKMLLPAAIVFSDYDERPMQESIARMTPFGWLSARLYEREGNLSEAAVCDSMNSGYGLGVWVGLGNTYGIGGSGPYYLTSDDADTLANGNRQGVHASDASGVGAWDRASRGDCFAEHLMNRVGGGCVGLAMNTRSGWGGRVDGVYVPGPSERMDTVFISRILNRTEYHAGQALAFARAWWAPYADSSAEYDKTRACVYSINYFGDPELSVWTAEPTNVTASHPGMVNVGHDMSYSVTVSSGGAPVESARVLLWKGSEVYVTGRTNALGRVTLHVSPVTTGPMKLTVDAHNHHLLQDTVQVVSSARYVVYLRSIILDPGPGGNNDSILNPGETVQIPMWVKNWGQQTANSVTAKLRSGDAHVRVTDSARSFGNINAGDSAYTGANGFGLRVDSGLANGYPVACSLFCKDALDSTWVSIVTYIVGTPLLDKRAVTVVDTAHGGNKNGRINPDETADLMVRIGNTGLGHGYDCRAVLRSGDSRFRVLDSTASFGLIRRGDSASNATDLFTVHADGTIPPETPISCTLYCHADGGYIRTEPFTIVVRGFRPGDAIPDGPRTPAVYYAYDDTDTLYTAHPTYDWVEVDLVGTRINFAYENEVALVTLPYAFGPFRFCGQRFTQLSIATDGWICPGNHTTANWRNTGLPDTADPPGMICANWDDLAPNFGAGGVYYYHDTTNHRFVVEYDSVWDRSNETRDKFEVIIFDTTVTTYTGDNAILVQYKTANGYSISTLGIEDPTETIAIQVLYNGDYHEAAAQPMAAGRAILYTTDPPWTAIRDECGPTGVPVKLALKVYPNPLRTRVVMAWELPVAGRVSLRIYDAAGRVTRDLVRTRMDAGRYSVTWGGRAADGRPVANGVYFCTLTTAVATRQQKLVVAKR